RERAPAGPAALSRHDALPIWLPGLQPGRRRPLQPEWRDDPAREEVEKPRQDPDQLPEPHREPDSESDLRRMPERPEEPHLRSLQDRKSTRLNSSHQIISYAVF